LLINLGETEDKRFQLFEPEGRVLKSPGASLKFIKKRFRQSEKGFGQQPVKIQNKKSFWLLNSACPVFGDFCIHYSFFSFRIPHSAFLSALRTS
jgi:hypothetical protein